MASVLSDALANRLKAMDNWFGQNKSKIEAVINAAKQPRGPKPGVGGGSCTLIWFLVFRGATGGYVPLRAIFTQPGDEPIIEELVVNHNASKAAIISSFNALATVVDNPDVFEITVDGGDLPQGEVEIMVKAASPWSFELEWIAGEEELEGQWRAASGLRRGRK